MIFVDFNDLLLWQNSSVVSDVFKFMDRLPYIYRLRYHDMVNPYSTKIPSYWPKATLWTLIQTFYTDHYNKYWPSIRLKTDQWCSPNAYMVFAFKFPMVMGMIMSTYWPLRYWLNGQSTIVVSIVVSEARINAIWSLQGCFGRLTSLNVIARLTFYSLNY